MIGVKTPVVDSINTHTTSVLSKHKYLDTRIDPELD
jgi:hypothetical protein